MQITGNHEFNPNSLTEKEIQAFIRENFPNFSKQINYALLRLHDNKDKYKNISLIETGIISFNPWTILTGFTWFYYRKIYLLSTLILCFKFLIDYFYHS